VLQLEPPFASRLPARPGRHRVELWLPGGRSPLATSAFLVRGGSP
jgi:penicillin-binding protein 1C